MELLLARDLLITIMNRLTLVDFERMIYFSVGAGLSFSLSKKTNKPKTFIFIIQIQLLSLTFTPIWNVRNVPTCFLNLVQFKGDIFLTQKGLFVQPDSE